MDSLVNLHLDSTGIEIIPPSVGQFCTNLVSCDLRGCTKLKKIEGNFRLLKFLKDLHLLGCFELDKLVWDFFDKECCLEVLSLTIKNKQSATFKNRMNHMCLQCFHQSTSVSPRLPQFPHFLRKLHLSWCNLGDGDIPPYFCELLNLQVLDLRGNQFSHLHNFGLSQIPCLKFLDLSDCTSLVELPDLPSSIAIINAYNCDSLESIGDLSKNKWLWKVSLWRRKNKSKLPGCKRVLHSMLQVNAIEGRFMSVILPIERPLEYSDHLSTLITMQLPHNWYSDFSGFLLCVDNHSVQPCTIIIKEELYKNFQPDHDQWEEFDKNLGSYDRYIRVAYLPFGSLGRIPWWNFGYTKIISFSIVGTSSAKVVFVPRRNKISDSRERPKASYDYFGSWDKESDDRKTFEIVDDSNPSSIEILWSHSYFG